MIGSESMLEFDENVVSVKVIHYLAVNNMLHRFTDCAGQCDWSVVSRVGLVAFFEDSCDVRLLPVGWYLASVIGLLVYEAQYWCKFL